jgi:hypothetical protein
LAFEKEVNEALQKHMRSLEEAHRNRETDWHELANKWKKYEEDAIAENHRSVLRMPQGSSNKSDIWSIQNQCPDALDVPGL